MANDTQNIRHMKATDSDVDILARPGANDQVMSKKVLLAMLAGAEAQRLGITPDAAFVGAVRENFLQGLELNDQAALLAWLADAGLSEQDFDTVMRDLAAVVAVEMHHAEALSPRVELHRRVVAARMGRLGLG